MKSVQAIRSQCTIKKRQLKPDIHPTLEHGWLLPTLWRMDSILWHRWDYWLTIATTGYLPQEQIPQILFDQPEFGNRPVMAMLEQCLDAIPQHGEWISWSSWQYFNYFLDWLLFGFGHHSNRTLPQEPAGCEGASDRLYQLFQLEAMQLYPHDYFASLLAQTNYGKRQGFYPTPMCVCQMMVQMTFLDSGKDTRLLKAGDPCTGTGRFPLAMSNYTLSIIAQDIDETLVRAALVNGYLYAPWFVKPLNNIGGDIRVGNSLTDTWRSVLTGHVATEPAQQKQLSDALTSSASAREDAASYLANTEYNSEGIRWEPVLTRRRRSKKHTTDDSEPTILQGCLF